MTYPLINGAAINTGGGSDGGGGEGPPSRTIRPVTLGAIASFGMPGVVGVDITLSPASLLRTTRFGTPTAVSQVVQPDNTSVVGVGLGSITTFGVAEVRTSLRVDIGSIAPSFVSGTPVAALANHVVGFQTTAFGEPRAARIVHAAGLQATSFGSIRAVRLVDVPSLPCLRYGAPGISGTTFSTAQGFRSTEFGVHSAHTIIHALPAAPGTRFGRPTLVRNSQC